MIPIKMHHNYQKRTNVKLDRVPISNKINSNGTVVNNQSADQVNNQHVTNSTDKLKHIFTILTDIYR
jgi:hypothetical protein